MAIYPFVLATKTEKENKVLMNHEKIHLEQQKEMFVIPFYILYLLSTYINVYRYFNINKAYRLNVFEIEAFGNEKDLSYINQRKRFAMFKNNIRHNWHISDVKSERSQITDRIGAAMIILTTGLFGWIGFNIIKEMIK